MSAHIHQMIPLYAAKSSNSASAATSPKALQKPDCATASIGSMKVAQSFLVSAFRQKDNEMGRQECLPHLHTRFLNGSSLSKRPCFGLPLDPSTSSGTAGSGGGSGCSRPTVDARPENGAEVLPDRLVPVPDARASSNAAGDASSA